MRDAQQTDMIVWSEETAAPVATEAITTAEAVPEQTPAPPPAPTDELALMLSDAATAAPTAEATTGRKDFHRAMGEALANMEALYNENHDLIGWIEIPEILSLPVVYKDNSYYLTHDFYKKKNTSGTIFLDVNHRFTEHTQNLLLHGHNMKDGTMFGRLTQYVHDIDYFKRHAFVNYDTLWEKEQYVMFAVLRVSLDVKSEQFFNYFTHPTFRSESEFENYVRQAQLRSVYAVPMDLKPDDALLTLSTCMDEDRLVILCRRIREGESRSQLRQTINLAVKQ